jgi:hypothetical protein
MIRDVGNPDINDPLLIFRIFIAVCQKMELGTGDVLNYTAKPPLRFFPFFGVLAAAKRK